MGFVQQISGTMPAIAVPLTAKTAPELIAQAKAVCASPAAIAEWRVDAWPDVPLAVGQTVAAALHAANKQLLLTCRTQAQGGAFVGAVSDYGALYRRLLAISPDAVDIEAHWPVAARKALVALVHEAGAAVVASAHDFTATPTLAAGQQQLTAQAAWADVVKLATMPQTPADTLTLLALSAWAKKALPCPAIVIGMGALGQLTRVATGAFASALTFATLGAASAPGQLSVQAIVGIQEG
ncbi:type I 3-dehydroquinate dehydratase [Lacticaseibacillus baoqingensis]|uniref:3-dehydroquinate dehydratase n=1 Tax=Lacticaseibacillus baoqingensis TaxID=2486013 RepID=A0ABW4E836_9LACO|nr:type I 3-dehydroquinate dehydratase [Lacticaseibacillus baoqingensis]